jgi:hypothetical protein
MSEYRITKMCFPFSFHAQNYTSLGSDSDVWNKTKRTRRHKPKFFTAKELKWWMHAFSTEVLDRIKKAISGTFYMIVKSASTHEWSFTQTHDMVPLMSRLITYNIHGSKMKHQSSIFSTCIPWSQFYLCQYKNTPVYSFSRRCGSQILTRKLKYTEHASKS